MLFAKLNNIANLNVYDFHILMKIESRIRGGSEQQSGEEGELL